MILRLAFISPIGYNYIDQARRRSNHAVRWKRPDLARGCSVLHRRARSLRSGHRLPNDVAVELAHARSLRPQDDRLLAGAGTESANRFPVQELVQPLEVIAHRTPAKALQGSVFIFQDIICWLCSSLTQIFRQLKIRNKQRQNWLLE